MKKLLLLWILIFSLQIFAQEIPQAVKFDVYSEENGENSKLLDEKINSFLKKLKEDSSVKGYVFIYDKLPRFFNTCKLSEITAPSEKQKEFIKKLNLPSEQVKNSCFRRSFEIEFWLVKNGVKPPDNNKYCADFHPPCCCPTVSISGKESVDSKTQPITFSVEISPLDEELTANYEWFVSNGKIISGQGTNQIKVDISDLNYGDSVTATVEAIGSVFCSEFCQRTVNFSTTLKKK